MKEALSHATDWQVAVNSRSEAPTAGQVREEALPLLLPRIRRRRYRLGVAGPDPPLAAHRRCPVHLRTAARTGTGAHLLDANQIRRQHIGETENSCDGTRCNRPGDKTQPSQKKADRPRQAEKRARQKLSPHMDSIHAATAPRLAMSKRQFRKE